MEKPLIAFKNTNSMMLNEMDELFQTVSIYKTLVICADDEETINVTNDLIEKDHSVATIVYEYIEDDVPHIVSELLDAFRNNSVRVLCMTYAAWHYHRDILDQYIMDHNLLVLGALDYNEQSIINQWIIDARRRGFRNTHGNYYIVFNNDNESSQSNYFLSNTVENEVTSNEA